MNNGPAPKDISTYDITWLRFVLEENAIVMTDTRAGLLAAYVDLLREWNSRINLVSRKSIDTVYREHILHCLAPQAIRALRDARRIVDAGTGGGLPGIPLAIMFPEKQFTLVDSIMKKCRAVQDMVETLRLPNVDVQCARVEELPLRSWADAVLFRAVARLDLITDWAIPILAHKGIIVAWKGGDVSSEIASVKKKKEVPSVRALPLEIKGETFFMDAKKLLCVIQIDKTADA